MGKKKERPTTTRTRRILREVGVFKRNKGTKDDPFLVWYFNYYYYDEQKGKEVRSTNFSTFFPCDNYSKEEAEREAYIIKKQKEFERKNKRDSQNNNKLLFSNYVADFFTEKCPYCRNLAKSGKKLANSTITERRRILENIWLPKFKNVDLRDITTSDIEKYIRNKYDYKDPTKDPEEWKQGALSGRSLNGYFDALSLVFAEAERLKDIEQGTNPVKSIIRYKDISKKKEPLTTAEFNKLFRAENSVSKNFKENIILYTITLLAGVCGFRQGEAGGLQVKDIDFDKRLIHLKGVWNFVGKEYKKGSQGTKDHERVVPLFKELIEPLKQCINILPGNPSAPEFDNRFIFSYDGKTPVSARHILDYFQIATKSIGIDEEERKRRQLNYHSLRHYCKTYLTYITNGNESIVNLILGHSGKGIQARYDHTTEERLNELRILHDEGREAETANRAVI